MIAPILVHMYSPQSAIYCDTVIMHIEYRMFSTDSTAFTENYTEYLNLE
jgi:hypothetical protein